MFKQFFILCVCLLQTSIFLPAEIPCLLMSVPKSGTHLATNLFNHLTKKKARFVKSANSTFLNRFLDSGKDHYLYCHFNTLFDAEYYRTTLSSVPMFVNIRDPRDVCVSNVGYYRDILDKILGKGASFDERLTHTIVFEDIKEMYGPTYNFEQALIAIREGKGTVIRFEDLVGPQGGGDLTAQKVIIRKVANKLNVEIDENEVLSIGTKIFGKSITFKKGQIGSWKTNFKPIHKDQFKNSRLGQILIELGYEKDNQW